MATVKSANVTKYDAGGSGDNYIDDGYIKSVEKVWIDSYVLTTVLGTEDSICIGYVPKNKKVTEIVVSMPVSGGAATSLATIYCGTGAGLVFTASTNFFGELKMDGVPLGTWDIGTASTLRLLPAYLGKLVPKATGIYIKIFQANELDFVITGGTIRSIIKYT